MAELFTLPLFNDAGLIGYYRLEGNSNDSSSGGHNGTDIDITYNAASGKFGQGANFNGTTSKITLGQISNSPGATFTLGCWFKTTDTGAVKRVITKFAGTGSANGTIIVDILADNTLRFIIDGVINLNLNSGVSVTDGVWHLAIGEVNAGTGNLWLDNVQKATGSCDNPIAALTDNFCLGEDSTINTPEYFKGSMDDVFFFNRVLTSAEKTSLYLTGGGALFFGEI